jgi:hypothetical protein
MKIAFEIECGLVGGMGPRVGVDINGEQVTSQILGQHTILEYSIDNQTDTEVVIHYKNKTVHDTIVVDGMIVADKWLKITKIWVDDILVHHLLCTTECTESADRPNADSLYQVGSLIYKFSKNYFTWYYDYMKKLDLQYASTHPDPEAEQKFLGYDQESTAIPEVQQLLESRGYSITS